MKIPFVKMQGIGNDFIVLSPLLGALPEKKLAKHKLKMISDRHFGIGADQILIVKPCSSKDAEYEFKIINSDGNEVEQCGNGARCVAKFLLNANMVLKNQVETTTRSRNKADERFQKVIKEEYAVLKNKILAEATIREKEDDEVVETLTAYTKKLQSSLHIINSMET